MANKQDETSTAESGGQAATEAAPAKAKPQTTGKPKLLPPYAVVLLNDEEHSFEFVVEALQKTFGYDLGKAVRLTLEAHESGRAVVWSGSKEVAEFKRERLRSCGPDVYASRPVNFPLGCEIEPMP
jgi:ATP-dependent Clp protease adaptor protein ClpS